MQVHLALFDPAFPTDKGTSWSWRSPELPLEFLDHLYYEFAQPLRPENPNNLELSDIIGGFLCESGWIAAYRFGNGGRDRQGRPGRFVLVVAAVPTKSARGNNLSSLLTSPEVEAILRRAPNECPLAAPSQLSVELPTVRAKPDPAALRQFRSSGVWSSGSQDALDRLGNLIGFFAEHGPWAAEVRIDRQSASVALRHLQTATSKTPTSTISEGALVDNLSPREANALSAQPPRSGGQPPLWLITSILLVTHFLAFSAGLATSRLFCPKKSSTQTTENGRSEKVIPIGPTGEQHGVLYPPEDSKLRRRPPEIPPRGYTPPGSPGEDVGPDFPERSHPRGIITNKLR